jgi:hypothetical protein
MTATPPLSPYAAYRRSAVDLVMTPSSSTRQSTGFHPLLAGVAVKITFELSYMYFISPLYSYAGLTLQLNVSKLIESYLIALVTLGLLAFRERTPSTVILLTGTYIGVIPLLSIYALQDRPSAFVYAAAVTFSLSIGLSSLPRCQMLLLRTRPEALLIGSLAISLAVTFWMTLNGAYKHFTFDVYSIYEFRHELDDIVFVGPFAYLTDWAGYVFNVVIFAWALQSRNWMLAVIALGLQIFLYGCTLNKSFLFCLPFAGGAVFYLVDRRGDVAGIGWLIALLILIGMLESIVLNESNITGTITRRVLALPAYLANEYYELFGRIGHVYWTNGFLGSLGQYPFADVPQRLIGKAALGHSETWANNGMFGTGFMHAGFVGMLGYGVMFGFWLYILDCIAVGKVPLAAAASVVILPMTNVLADSDLTTGLLTHGGAAATVMLWLWAGTVQPRQQARPANMSVVAGARSG